MDDLPQAACYGGSSVGSAVSSVLQTEALAGLGSTITLSVGICVASMCVVLSNFPILPSQNGPSYRACSDHYLIKVLVAIVWLLDTAHQGALIHICHTISFGLFSFASIKDGVRSVAAEILLNLGLLFKGIYLVYRVRLVSNNAWIAGLCGFLALLTLGSGIWFSAKIYLYSCSMSPADIMNEARPYLLISLSMALASDTTIAVFLTTYLYQKRTGFKQSNDIIARIIILTVSTGSLTTCFTIANIVAYTMRPFAFYDFFFNFMLSKLYANALLTMYEHLDPDINVGVDTNICRLNTRSIIRGQHSQPKRDGLDNLDTVPSGMLAARGINESAARTINILVTQSVETDEASSTKQHLKDIV
ncbi:hypothetical protein NM688_g3939 [Phlebia brevispora]|uniref:Uncharacterized protein n=1 Tax=Phlebia brevispora TaxID=194682 RepID=A0ACC1T4A4_9APHY|nr:hypothetical protein NM688_g3939 [Phlebia brevispora]